MRIDRVEEARLTPSDEAAIATLLSRSFGDDYGGRSFWFQRSHVRFLARDGDRIVGHLALGLRMVRLGDRLLDIAAVADVATDPERRGEGVASALMPAMIDEARGMRADAAVLFGDSALYSAHGFIRRPNPLRWLDLTGRRTRGIHDGTHPGLMVLPLSDTPWDDTALLDLLGHKF